MKIEVRLFATLRENRGKVLTMEFEEGSTAKEVITQLNIPIEEAAILLINGKHEALDYQLIDHDVVSIFPPVGGG
ncbi:MoaD/ThiS family protein [Alkaliphilus serpentinus]|uniref:MoaD/ThiS family protein n=1 Tax=Alkaliphilus serpentinus TaxID=1482731 RepID=A0A833MAL1_9FIRM|nr:MoaD/ThiS family protein [Alkaliphilus serpentinus]KAB3532514.1 MoaD/ThiS family protein [Alkaliphilus serpentinus]